MNFDQFIANYNRSGPPGFDFDGAYGAQCVDLIAFYIRDCFGGTSFRGNARDWYEQYGKRGDLHTKFDRITNNPKDLNQRPNRGDIVIFSGSLPGSGDSTHNPATGNGYGHICIWNSRPAAGQFISFDQNWGGMFPHMVTHNYNHVLGWLTPKVAPAQAPASAPAPTPQPQGGIILNDGQVRALYQLILHRAGDEGGVKNYAGKPLDFMLSDIASSQEWRNQNHQQLITLPEQSAQLSNMQNQINGLNQTITNLTLDLQNSNTNSTEKTQALNDAIAKVGALTSELEAAHDKAVQCQVPAEINEQKIEKTATVKDPNIPNPFFKILAVLITKLVRR